MSQFVSYRDDRGVLRQIEVYSKVDYTDTPTPFSPVRTNSSGLISNSMLESIGENVVSITERFSLSAENILSKKLVLSKTLVFNSITVVPEDGPPQINNRDFIFNATSNSISWDGLGLDGFLEEGEILEVTYFHVPSGPTLGESAVSISERFSLSSEDISAKYVILSKALIFNSITVIPEGGSPQINGRDFVYNSANNSISWDGLGLDGFLEEGEILDITYFHGMGDFLLH